MAGRRGPAIFRISPSAGRIARASRRAWRPGSAGPVPASSSGAARGWAYTPDSTMADFISNSAILPAISPGALLADAPWTGLERHKLQSLASTRPSRGRQHWDCRGGHRPPRHLNLARLDRNADWTGPTIRRMTRTVRRFTIRTDGSVSLKRRLFTARNVSLNEIRGCKTSSPGRAQ